jgi:hypothetical protein
MLLGNFSSTNSGNTKAGMISWAARHALSTVALKGALGKCPDRVADFSPLLECKTLKTVRVSSAQKEDVRVIARDVRLVVVD